MVLARVEDVGCCLVGCLRFLLFQVWKLALAALFAMLLARIDDHVERRYGDRAAGKAWRAYRRRGKKPDTQA
jgi:hypothetical protein